MYRAPTVAGIVCLCWQGTQCDDAAVVLRQFLQGDGAAVGFGGLVLLRRAQMPQRSELAKIAIALHVCGQ